MDPMQMWSMNIDASLLDGQMQQQQHQQAQQAGNGGNMENVFIDSAPAQSQGMM